jgi:hypothetical protein
MRSLCIAAALAAILASSAFAQSTRNSQRPTQTQQPATSNEVYSGGRRLGTDPDPNIRFELMRQQNWRGGG